jgi:hypothetical protein
MKLSYLRFPHFPMYKIIIPLIAIAFVLTTTAL